MKLLQHSTQHQAQKHVQNAFNTLTEGMKIYGTLRGAFEVGRGMYQGAAAFYRVAAPVVAALL